MQTGAFFGTEGPRKFAPRGSKGKETRPGRSTAGRGEDLFLQLEHFEYWGGRETIFRFGGGLVWFVE